VIEFGLNLGDPLELKIQLRTAIVKSADDALKLLTGDGSAGRRPGGRSAFGHGEDEYTLQRD
jgi:hypothetical protein